MRVPIDTYYLTLFTFFAWKAVMAARGSAAERMPSKQEPQPRDYNQQMQFVHELLPYALP
jgi:hypothetical protein